MTFKEKVMRRMSKPLKFKSDRAICETLKCGGFDALEAYKLGAEEGKWEMLQRVAQMNDPDSKP